MISEELDPQILAAHEKMYVDSKTEDQILENYFASTRNIPSPLEIKIYTRQIKESPEWKHQYEERLRQHVKAYVKPTTRLTEMKE